MAARRPMILSAALLAAATAGTPFASAAPPSVTPLMQRAFAQYEQGPEQLRRYVYRTRMIYGLDFTEVVKAYEAVRTAQGSAAANATKVASATDSVR